MLSLLFPESCPICKKRGPAPCQRCRAQLPAALSLYPPALVTEIYSVTAYEGSGTELVKAIKYQNRRGAIAWCAEVLALQIGQKPDVVTWVPSSGRGKRRRGYEPSRLLAEAIADCLQVSAVALFLRDTHDGGQTARDRHARLRGPQLRLRRSLPGSSVLLVDDVSTTGSSLTAAAKILRHAGVTTVDAAVIARTP